MYGSLEDLLIKEMQKEHLKIILYKVKTIKKMRMKLCFSVRKSKKVKFKEVDGNH